VARFKAFRSTGLYCVPSCGPPPANERPLRFELAAEAEAEGFRACAHCRPYRPPVAGYMSAPDIVCRGVEMILAGEIDQEPEDHLAGELGVSSRHLRRLFVTHLGVTPTHLARSSRAHFARRLIDDTDLTVTDIASAAGFGSVRQMNRVFKEIFRCTPTEARAKRKERPEYVADGGLRLELP